jgi:hypothetical protein
MDSTSSNTNKEGSCQNDKVCMSKGEYQELLQSRAGVLPPDNNYPATLVPKTFTRERDMRVLHDELYPALNRSDRGSYEGVLQKTAERQINVPTRYYNDSYRLIGYMTNEDDEIKNWKVFGKQTDRNKGEFYAIPANRNYDMKVQLTDSITVGEKLRDLDTMPSELKFKTPLLSDTPYVFSELPKGQLRDELDI